MKTFSGYYAQIQKGKCMFESLDPPRNGLVLDSFVAATAALGIVDACLTIFPNVCGLLNYDYA